jgi:hypothetical protein
MRIDASGASKTASVIIRISMLSLSLLSNLILGVGPEVQSTCYSAAWISLNRYCR